ncbi:MAG: hypothetical protein ABSB59_19835 [Streptosporangiaceae bacterium]|jgi:hypothetical protein
MIDTADLSSSLARSVWFTVTEEHLKLLRHLFIHWDEGEGYGGPAISCKRPYGNSAVPENVAEILGLPEDRMLRVHVEAGIALKVVLAAGEFRPGRYCREGDYGWRRVGDRP